MRIAPTLMLALTACSMGVQPVRHGAIIPDCTTSNVLPAIDLLATVGTAIGSWVVLKDAGPCRDNPGCVVYLVLPLVSLTYLVSGLGGLAKTGECRAAKRRHARSEEAEHAVAEERYLGGSVRGLRSSLTLVEGDERVTIARDGEFRFENRPVGARFRVEVLEQPPGQRCEVEGGRGVVGDYAFVKVTCADDEN